MAALSTAPPILRAALASAALLAAGSAAAQLLTFTETTSGPGLVPLGYPVPVPVESQTPVAGFRSYATLLARLDSLALDSAHIRGSDVGQTLAARPIRAYVLSDDDALTAEGFAEPAALVSGTVHAREWASPEVVSELVEHYARNEGDTGLVRYLRENLNLVTLPVLNVDGFLQTQRYPTQALQTEFPGDPQPAQQTAEPPEYRNYPRDGRFRRKTMRGVDEILCAANDPACPVADGMRGVDVNRNHTPFFGSNNQNSALEGSLLHRGSGAGSEPESQALYAAGALGPESRLRLFIDVHSFSRVYFGAETGNARRDAQARTLAGVMARATGRSYPYLPSAAGSGIGSSDEHYGNRLQIPAYTLEIEPDGGGASAYGGFGYHHDGFVLPDNQIGRVREELLRATLAGVYRMAGPPVLLGATLTRSSDGAAVFAAQRPRSGSGRGLSVSRGLALQAGTDYRLRLDFSKPMRTRNLEAAVVQFPGQSVSLAPAIAIEGLDVGGTAFRHDLATPVDGWQGTGLRYVDDRYELTFRLPATVPLAGARRINLRVETTDFTGLALDADPATVADWSAGWSGYEDAAGRTTTDTGGPDRTLRLVDDGSPLFPGNGAAGGGGGGALSWLALALPGLLALARRRRNPARG